MQESTEPSFTKPVASEMQGDPANRAHSESRNSAPQSGVAANFVEIFQIAKPDSSNKKNEGEEETEDEADDKANSPDEEYMTGEGAYHELEQKTTKKEPLPSEITLAAAKQAVERREENEVRILMHKFEQQRAEERRAEEKQAQVRAYEEEHRLRREDSDDQEDEEEFAEEEQSETPPDQIIINIGGRPAKTAGLTDMEDLIRRNEVIEAVQYVSAEDGIINQYWGRSELRWDLRSVDLYTNL